MTASPGQGALGEGHAGPGLQAERTSLAWSRTLIGLVAVIALCVRTTAHLPTTALLSAAPYAVAAALVALRQGVRYRRASGGLGSQSVTASVFDVFVLAGTTVGLAVQILWWMATSINR